MTWKKELFYRAFVTATGKVLHEKSSIKLWASLSGLFAAIWMFLGLPVLITIGLVSDEINQYPWDFIMGLTGLTFGHTAIAVGWYALSKKIDIQSPKREDTIND